MAGGSTIVYEIVGNRMCHRIGRQHRSNGWAAHCLKYIVDSCGLLPGIYFVAKLQYGVFFQVWT